jgi:hypothetical protein
MKRIRATVPAIFMMIALSLSATAQERSAPSAEENISRNSVYIEIFGNAGLYSINYERRFNARFTGRIGFASFTSELYGDNTRITDFPLSVSYVTGTNKSHFEAGGGILLGIKKEYDISSTIVDLIGFIGYRYQPAGKGILLRIGLTPFYSLDDKANYPDNGFMLSGGLSLGYHF